MVESDWLPLFVPNLCHFSKPLDEPPPRYQKDSGNVVCHMTSNFGTLVVNVQLSHKHFLPEFLIHIRVCADIFFVH